MSKKIKNLLKTWEYVCTNNQRSLTKSEYRKLTKAVAERCVRGLKKAS